MVQIYKPVRTCVTCSKPGPSQKCPCGTASYCGVECQKASWKTHRGDCTIHLYAQAQAAKHEHGTDSPETILANYKLALLFSKQQQMVKSQKILVKCLEVCNRLRSHHQRFAIASPHIILPITHSLSETYGKQDNFGMQQELLEKALVIARQLYDENDGEVQRLVSALESRRPDTSD
jgi:hypothetical protein